MYEQKKQEILSYLYQLRVLSDIQVSEYFFKSQGFSMAYYFKVLQDMCVNRLVFKEKVNNENVIFTISRKGVDFLRKHGIIMIGDSESIFKDDFLQPCKIKIQNVYVSHQLSLNHAVLRFGKEFHNIDYQYYDEKYLSQLPHIRPDGLFKVGNKLLFLEMDMGTERQASLKKKWDNYEMFLNSTFCYNLSESITVLFITHRKARSRTKKLQSYISSYLLDKITPDFNIYVGDEDSIFNYLHEVLDRTSSPLPVGLCDFCQVEHFTSDGLDGFLFDKYLYLPDGDSIKQINGETFDFLYDDYTYNNMYVCRKLCRMQTLLSSMKSKIKRTVKYLILVNSEKEALDLLQITNAYPINVFFTTKERLKRYSIFEALFFIDKDGTLCHFAENHLDVKIPEYKFSSF